MVYELAVVCGRILLTTSDYSLPVLRPLSDTSANVPTDDPVTSKWLSRNNQTATEWPNSGNSVPVPHAPCGLSMSRYSNINKWLCQCLFDYGASLCIHVVSAVFRQLLVNVAVRNTRHIFQLLTLDSNTAFIVIGLRTTCYNVQHSHTPIVHSKLDYCNRTYNTALKMHNRKCEPENARFQDAGPIWTYSS